MRKYFLLLMLVSGLLQVSGQIPSGYYNGTEGLEGTALRSALHTIIDNHTSISYTSIWTHVQTTDKKSNGKVWDMYSDVPGGTPPYEFTFSSDQCGNYSGEADCYNREHSWPQSWFNSNSPMVSDLFHIYPTDGYVNGQRGNYAFGEVGTATWTSQNGSKKGNCVYPGYTGTVFEPIDAYKGDFARTFFYMATRYYTEDSGWLTTEATDGAELFSWTKNLLMEWHIKDPVSAKEIARNNAVYGIQHNRNPYIDHPEFAMLIFGDDYPQAELSYQTPVDTILVGELYSLHLSAVDDYANAISFTALGTPGWLGFTDHLDNSADFSGQPAAIDTGLFSFSITYGNAYSPAQEADFQVYVKASVSVSEIKSPHGIVLFPNPADDFITLNTYPQGLIRIVNMLGETMLSLENCHSPIFVGDLQPGIYFLQSTGNSHGSIFVKR